MVPLDLRLVKEEICEDIPRRQVSAVEGEWPMIVEALYDCGLVPVESMSQR